MVIRALVLAAAVSVLTAQNKPPAEVAGIPVNYDEARVGEYKLPDPLLLANGKPVRDVKTWEKKRRPEIVRLYEENQFGRVPAGVKPATFDVFDKGTPAMGGKALRRQVAVQFAAGPRADLVLYLPPTARGRVPLLLTINFSANASTFDDTDLALGEVWGRDHKRVPAQRTGPFGKMRIDELLAAGFGVAGIYYGDIDPDFAGGIAHGVRAATLAPGHSEPAADEWGSIAAWAWGLSQVMDYLETDASVDARRVALYGVSRLGKTVLWAGARDPRFAMVIASCSGEGGAALSRRNYGETIAHLTAPTRYGYQFAANYAKFGTRVSEFPVDGHMLIALMAPRPVFLQTGDSDFWSDPKGEFLAAVAAEPVYRLYGKQGLGTVTMPPAGRTLMNMIGYQMHAGGHGTLPGDWEHLVEFLRLRLQKN